MTAISAPIPRLLPVTSTTRPASNSVIGRLRPGVARVPARIAPAGSATTGGGAVESRSTSSVGRTVGSGERPASSRLRELEPAPPDLVERQPDRGQAGRSHGGRGDVVKARHRDVGRDADPERLEPAHGPQREQVVGGTDRGERRVSGQQRVDGQFATRLVEAGAHDEAIVGGDPGRGQPMLIAGQPVARDVERPRAGQECDLPMPERHQRRDHGRDPGGIVDPDVRIAKGMRRQMHDRSAIAAHRGEVPGQFLVGGRIVESAAGKDDRRRPHGTEQPDVRVLALGIPIRTPDDDQRATDRGGILDPAHDLREVRVRDVVDDHPDDRHVALVEATGQRVGDVVERTGRIQHPLARGRADRVRRGRDDARDGRRRDAGQAGHVQDRCHVGAQNGNVGGSSRTVTHCHSVSRSRLASPP